MQIPQSHRDLFEGPYRICLSTVTANGQPYSTPAWCALEDDSLLVVVTGSEYETLLQGNSYFSLLAYDPRDPLRNMEIRGQTIKMENDGSLEQLDRLTRIYTSKSTAEYFASRKAQDARCPICLRITPERIRVEGSS